MRIVQVVPSLDVGGAERMAALLSRELAVLGHDVALVSLFDPAGSWIEAELRAAGVPLRFLGKRPGLDPRMIPRLRRVLAELRPDVVHTHLHALKYALGHAGVHTVHNLAEHEADRVDRLLHHVAFRRGVVPVAIGEAVAESLRRVYRITPRFTIPNGIPVAACRAPEGARAEVRAELGIPEDTPVFLTVGRLNAQKNHAALLAAFETLRGTSPRGARLLVAGEGELRRALGRQASEGVEFLGVRKDVPRLLAAADVFVLASTWEGNPLVVMEAMAAGLPVVATAVGCVPELVSARTGRLVAPGDVPALATAMAAMAADLPAARAFGDAGAAVARERFDASVMARAYEALYAGMVRRPC